MKKKLSFILAVVMLLSLLLCACGSGSDSKNATLKTKLTDKYLVQQGVSNYVLVLPNSAMMYETYAAQEFAYFIEQATGCKIETVTETTVPEGKKYISLGKTNQFMAAFPKETLEEVAGTMSSYLIASKDDNIYIAGSNDHRGQAVLWGVYDILNDLIGYTYYHNSEIFYTKSADVNLWKYDRNVVVPSFDMRTHSTNYIYAFPNDTHGIRLRYINFSRGLEWDPLTAGHSQVYIFLAPRDEDENGVRYGDSHPEWFIDPTANGVSKSENQLCWTAGGDPESLDLMQTIIAEEMLHYVQMDSDATFFMLGQQDTEYVCQCAGCTKALSEWGGSACGLQIDFVNGVIEKTEAMIAENCPGREVLYAIYAYKPTETPPVKTDANGNYVPYSDRIIPHEKLRVFFAPVRLNFGFSFDSPYNADAYKNLLGWDAVCTDEQLMVYTYDLNIHQYFVNFYNLGTIASHMQDYEKAGVSYLLSQGISDANATCFDELRAYCISRLMWDTSLNTQELAADFIDHYYKDGADAMQTLFDMIVEQNAWFLATEDPGSGVATGLTYNTTCYPRAFVEKMDAQIFAAMDAIAHLESSDPEQYELLKARIMKEYLSNIYLKMVLYRDFYTESEVGEMEEIWNRYIAYWNIKKGGEGADLPNIFA